MVEGFLAEGEKLLVFQISKADGFPLAEGVGSVHTQQDRVCLDRAVFIALSQVTLRGGNQRDSGVIGLYIALQLGVGHLIDFQINLRVILPKGKKRIRVQNAEQKRGTGQRQLPALLRKKQLGLALQPAETLDQRPKALNKVFALCCEYATRGTAGKKPTAELILQLLYDAAQGLLGDIELLRRLGEGTVTACLNEVFNLF